MAQADIGDIAAKVIAALRDRSRVSCFSCRPDGLTLRQAYQITPLLRAAFEAEGERMTGRKIGFTNRQMWSAFGVQSPIWGYTTSRTTHDLIDVRAVSLAEFAEPRIEPEIIFGLKAAPKPAMTDEALIDCLEWISLGFEVVQSIYPGWKFSAPDTIAANGLHGKLLIGPRHAIAPRRTQWIRQLSAFEIDLFCDGELLQRGGGALVLDSPLNALRELIGLLAADPTNPSLEAGEVVSTGTLTLATPVKPGERWIARATGIPLDEISVRFE
ncbi:MULTISPECIES: hydratase [Bradyrhizobium]|jgi:2-oxo-3-hexenedioate decarboxylase|uniref:2-keto-4-pentenoate hydratase n=1 Tax=Bradyrhizobium TaxID=374 RepID=UPI0004208CB3|nr:MULTISPECIES: hydratase [Bradyrhizobium]KIU46360.1 hydratase [Bradyrhizobium elkanii]OCX26158.1 hydratase [Bradyrhizobium sp. UASWS1016]